MASLGTPGASGAGGEERGDAARSPRERIRPYPVDGGFIPSPGASAHSCLSAELPKELKYRGDSPLISPSFVGLDPELVLAWSAGVYRKLLDSLEPQNIVDAEAGDRLARDLRKCAGVAAQGLHSLGDFGAPTLEAQLGFLSRFIPVQIPDVRDYRDPWNLPIFSHNKLVSSTVATLQFWKLLGNSGESGSVVISHNLREFIASALVLPLTADEQGAPLLRRAIFSQAVRCAFRSGNMPALYELHRRASGPEVEYFFDVVTVDCREWFEALRRLPVENGALDQGERSQGGCEEQALADSVSLERLRFERPLGLVACSCLAWAITQEASGRRTDFPFPDEAGDLFLDPRYGFGSWSQAVDSTRPLREIQLEALADICRIGGTGGREEARTLLSVFTESDASAARLPVRRAMHGLLARVAVPV